MEIKQKSASAQEDLILVEEAQNGSQKAYAVLMKKYHSIILFLVSKIIHNKDDAMDVTIEAFGKAFEKLDKYQPSFAFSTWLSKVATNNAIDFIRKQKLNTIPIDENPDDESSSVYTARNIRDTNLNPEEHSVKKQELENVRQIIEQLPPRYQTIFTMRHFDELSYEEISEQLGIPMGTVKTRLFKCRDLLSHIVRSKQANL